LFAPHRNRVSILFSWIVLSFSFCLSVCVL
jgi:hypothetical protein